MAMEASSYPELPRLPSTSLAFPGMNPSVTTFDVNATIMQETLEDVLRDICEFADSWGWPTP